MGLIARINEDLAASSKRVGYLTPLLYQNADGGAGIGSTCNDVTQGDNVTAADGGYKSGKGYDAATGWGSPNGVALEAALKPLI